MDYEIRRYRPGDEHAILETFHLVFSRDDPSFRPRSLEDWRWQYLENPAGIRIYVAMHGDTCAAFYAFQPYRVRLEDGSETIFAQGTDSMAHPEHRRGLKRPGLFVQTAQSLFDDYVGDPVSYGLPNRPAWRVGRTMLRYELVRWQTVLVRELGGLDFSLPPEVEELDSFGPEVEELYERCAADWGVSVIRDASFLNWRFFGSPTRRYRVFAVRDAERLAGYAVYRREAEWPFPDATLVVDFLVPPDELQVAASLRDAVVAAALADGREYLLQIQPEWSPWSRTFQHWGWYWMPTDYLFSARKNLPCFDMHWLRDRWWYTCAEVDLA